MGQAKQRGTFEDRKADALWRKEQEEMARQMQARQPRAIVPPASPFPDTLEEASSAGSRRSGYGPSPIRRMLPVALALGLAMASDGLSSQRRGKK